MTLPAGAIVVQSRAASGLHSAQATIELVIVAPSKQSEVSISDLRVALRSAIDTWNAATLHCVERATVGGEPTITNTAVLFDGKGVSGWYDKRVLVPIGEQPVVIDLPGFDGRELLAPVTRYSPGSAREPLGLGGHRMAAMICHEDLLPAHVRDLVSNGNPEFLVSPSSDAWFEGEVARELHFMLASLRSVETRCQLLRVSHDGLSGLVASTGVTARFLPTKVLAIDAVTARWLEGVTLYSRFGDGPMLWFAALTILVGAGVRRLRIEAR